MKDWARIYFLEEQVEFITGKIERMKKHNEERSPVGREGMAEQIETHIRIACDRKRRMVEEIEELRNGS